MTAGKEAPNIETSYSFRSSLVAEVLCSRLAPSVKLKCKQHGGKKVRFNTNILIKYSVIKYGNAILPARAGFKIHSDV